MNFCLLFIVVNNYFIKKKIYHIFKIMSNYTLILEKENIRILKGKNKFKLEINSKIKSDCDIIEKFSNDQIYKLLKITNQDIIDNIIVDNKENSDTNIIMVFNNILVNEDVEDLDDKKKYFISFSKNIIQHKKNSIEILGDKNTIEFVKEKYIKLDLEQVYFNLNIYKDILYLTIKIKYNGNTLPIFMENYIGKIFGKIFKQLLKYYEK